MYPTVDQLFAPVLFICQTISNFIKKETNRYRANKLLLLHDYSHDQSLLYDFKFDLDVCQRKQLSIVELSILNKPKDLSVFFCESHSRLKDSCTSKFSSRLQSSHKYAFVLYIQATLTLLPPQFLTQYSQFSVFSQPILHECVVKQNCFYFVVFLSGFMIVLII